MELILLAKSSSHPEEPYRVAFKLNSDGRLQVLCDCPAGQFGQFCKHKVSLIQNDARMLFDVEQKGELQKVQEWVKDSGLPAMVEDVKRIERELEGIKKRLKNAKAMLGRVMVEGSKK